MFKASFAPSNVPYIYIYIYIYIYTHFGRGNAIDNMLTTTSNLNSMEISVQFQKRWSWCAQTCIEFSDECSSRKCDPGHRKWQFSPVRKICKPNRLFFNAKPLNIISVKSLALHNIALTDKTDRRRLDPRLWMTASLMSLSFVRAVLDRCSFTVEITVWLPDVYQYVAGNWHVDYGFWRMALWVQMMGLV